MQVPSSSFVLQVSSAGTSLYAMDTSTTSTDTTISMTQHQVSRLNSTPGVKSLATFARSSTLDLAFRNFSSTTEGNRLKVFHCSSSFLHALATSHTTCPYSLTTHDIVANLERSTAVQVRPVKFMHDILRSMLAGSWAVWARFFSMGQYLCNSSFTRRKKGLRHQVAMAIILHLSIPLRISGPICTTRLSVGTGSGDLTFMSHRSSQTCHKLPDSCTFM